MKRLFAMVLTAVMILSLAACGGKSAESKDPETQPTLQTVVQEQPTEATQPSPFMEVGNAYAMAMGDFEYCQNCTLELIDEKTVRVRMYRVAIYPKTYVEGLQVGDTVLVGEKAVTVEELERQENPGENIRVIINPNSENHRVEFVGGQIGIMSIPITTEDMLKDFIAYYQGETVLCLVREEDARANSMLKYIDMAAGGETQFGADLVKVLQEDPGHFTIRNTEVALQEGRVIQVTRYNFD